MKKTTVVTDCGHRWRTGRRPEHLVDHTIDCRVCGALLIFPYETTLPGYVVVRARAFHTYLHEGWPDWPVDGSGTAYAEFSEFDTTIKEWEVMFGETE